MALEGSMEKFVFQGSRSGALHVAESLGCRASTRLLAGNGLWRCFACADTRVLALSESNGV